MIISLNAVMVQPIIEILQDESKSYQKCGCRLVSVKNIKAHFQNSWKLAFQKSRCRQFYLMSVHWNRLDSNAEPRERFLC